MALNKREQMLLMMVVATVIVVGNWILVVPLIQTARNRETAIAQERAKLERVRRTVEVDGPRWRAEYEQLQDSLGERASVFSTTSDVLKKVEDVGTECGLAVPVKKSLAPVERDVYRELQNRELEPPANEDEFGQGSGRPANPNQAGMQPDFALYGTMQELPNRGTSTYRAEFQLTDLRNRTIVWSDEYTNFAGNIKAKGGTKGGDGERSDEPGLHGQGSP